MYYYLVNRQNCNSSRFKPVQADESWEVQVFSNQHGVQRRMISVDNFFVFLRLLFFAVLLLYVT